MGFIFVSQKLITFHPVSTTSPLFLVRKMCTSDHHKSHLEFWRVPLWYFCRLIPKKKKNYYSKFDSSHITTYFFLYLKKFWPSPKEFWTYRSTDILKNAKLLTKISLGRSFPELMPRFCATNCSQVIFFLTFGLCNAVLSIMMENDRR